MSKRSQSSIFFCNWFHIFLILPYSFPYHAVPLMVLCTVQLNETKKEALRINTQEVSNICSALRNTTETTKTGVMGCFNRSIGITTKIAPSKFFILRIMLLKVCRMSYLSRNRNIYIDFLLTVFPMLCIWYSSLRCARVLKENS